MSDTFETLGDPVNLRTRAVSAEAFKTDVDYGIQITDGFRMWSRGIGFEIEGKKVLEIGPGINLAGSLGLKALHAEAVYVSDRWLPPWQADYNPVFCRMMAARIRKDRPDWDPSPLETAAAGGGYAGVLNVIQSPVERLGGRIPEPLDATFSVAVLEHVADHKATAAALYDITRPGGMGFHQVDFRCHKDFSFPLEHMLMSEEEFRKEAVACDFDFGCQVRPYELKAIFEATGFSAVWHPNSCAEPDYFESFLRKLRVSPSRYRDVPANLLKDTGGLFIITRKG